MKFAGLRAFVRRNEQQFSSPPVVFLGGPIKAGFSSDGEFDVAFRSLIVDCISSLRNANHRVFSAHEAENFGKLSPEDRLGISTRDDNWMRNCDVYIALLPLSPSGLPISTIGTGVEIGWALRDRVPVLILIEGRESAVYSPFLHDLGNRGELEIRDLGAVMDKPDIIVEFVSEILSSSFYQKGRT